MISWSRSLVVSLVFVGFSLSAEARADDPRIAQAREIYAEALKLANESRDAEALKKFEEAYAVYPGPNILAAVGREKQVLGRELEGIRDLRAALRDPLLNPENTARVTKHIAEAEAKLGRVQVNGPEGTKVTVGDRVQTLPLREPIDVARGPFHIRATFAGKTKEISGDAKAGALTTVAVAFDDAAAEVTPPPREEPASNSTLWKPLTFVFGGATLVAGGLALYFNAKSRSAEDRSTALRSEHAGANCSAGSVPSFCSDILAADSDQDSAASASKVLWVGAGALLAATGISGVLWATNGSRVRSSATLIPTASPSTAGATLRVVF